jgi:hypothetical protein
MNAFSSAGYKNINTKFDTKTNTNYQWNNKNNSWSVAGNTPNSWNAYNPNGVSYGSSQANGMVYGSSNSIPSSKPGNYSWQKYAAGGSVIGNGMGDNVPTMLNGGEFIISKQAAQNIGGNKLNQLNSTGKTSDLSDILVAKLDELVEKLSAVGTLNITVNSDSNGKETNSESSGNQDQRTKEMAKKIKEVVMSVLKEEKRLGGMLR